jgi:hypothetical protein
MHPVDPEAIVDAALSELPQPRAPHTLLPRVMAAVHAWANRPWYARAWFTWPVAGQVASLAALLLLVGGIAFMLRGSEIHVTTLIASLTGGPQGRVADLFRDARLASAAAQALWRPLLQPLLLVAFVLVMTMSAACVGFGAALNYVTLGKAFRT